MAYQLAMDNQIKSFSMLQNAKLTFVKQSTEAEQFRFMIGTFPEPKFLTHKTF